MEINEVVPWGRSLAEYVQMFDLPTSVIGVKILDCAGGPSGFNSTMTKLGGNVTSCDIVYNQTKEELSTKINNLYSQVKTEVENLKKIHPPEAIEAFVALNSMRIEAMNEFLEDYEIGKTQGRYVHAGLPSLPFKEKQFDIALCSHFLFTYSNQLSLEFHLNSIKELVRVSKEVRIFPLFNIDGTKSPYLEPAVASLTSDGYKIQIQEVNYQVLEGANQMMVVCD